MTTEIATYTFPTNGAQVRTAHLDGAPWFVAADICAALDIQNASQAIRNHLDPDEYMQVSATLFSNEGGGPPTYNLVTESGMYALILRSRKKEARAFRRWVTDVVLPALRKDGHVDLRAAAAPTAPPAIDIDMQARVIANLSGVIAPDYLEAKARIVLARALGEAPEIDPARRPLTVSDYFTERGMTEDAARPYASRFGKAIKGLYVAKHDREPAMADRFINGSTRRVKAYTEADRPLFDAAWQQMFPAAIGA